MTAFRVYTLTGDPLSPCLLIMCVETFSCLLEEALDSGDIHGVKVGRGSPSISHHFFADDFIIFTRSNVQEADKVLQIIKSYENASG